MPPLVGRPERIAVHPESDVVDGLPAIEPALDFLSQIRERPCLGWWSFHSRSPFPAVLEGHTALRRGMLQKVSYVSIAATQLHSDLLVLPVFLHGKLPGVGSVHINGERTYEVNGHRHHIGKGCRGPGQIGRAHV